MYKATGIEIHGVLESLNDMKKLLTDLTSMGYTVGHYKISTEFKEMRFTCDYINTSKGNGLEKVE